MSGTRMIVGLGNPGKKYAGTRHNVGFEVIDMLASVLAVEVKRKKFGAVFGVCVSVDKKLILLKPWQFMNCSGTPVVKAANFYKLALSDLLVISDDMALVPGQIRLRRRGSAGGHNGLADIIEKLGDNEFSRLRVGIGRNEVMDEVAYVLGQVSGGQRDLMDQAVERAKEAAVCWLHADIETAMDEYNEFKG